jgi:hypothetical protein
LGHLMDELAGLVASNTCRIKIFAIVDLTYAQGEWYMDQWSIEVRNRVICHADWDQSRLPRYERDWNNLRKLRMGNEGDAVAGAKAVGE